MAMGAVLYIGLLKGTCMGFYIWFLKGYYKGSVRYGLWGFPCYNYSIGFFSLLASLQNHFAKSLTNHSEISKKYFMIPNGYQQLALTTLNLIKFVGNAQKFGGKARVPNKTQNFVGNQNQLD